MSQKNQEVTDTAGKSSVQEFKYVERGGAIHHREERKLAEERGRHAPADGEKRWATTAHLTTAWKEVTWFSRISTAHK